MASRSVLQTANHLRQPSDPLLNCLFSNINKYFQIPIKSFTMSVRHIHTQAQALAERERQRVAQRPSDIQWKETMLNDPEYRKQVLQSRKISRDKK